MAKITRYLFGGILGAGLALILTPKKGSDMRRMLMGQKKQAALPSPDEAASAVANRAEPEPVDLDARIEETRRQVEEELAQPFAGEATVAPPEPETVPHVEEPAISEPVAEIAEPDLEPKEAESIEAEVEMTSPVDEIVALPAEPEVAEVETEPEAAPEEEAAVEADNQSWEIEEDDIQVVTEADTAAEEAPVIIDDGSEDDSGFYQIPPIEEPEAPAEAAEPVEETVMEAPEPVEEVVMEAAAEEPDVVVEASEEEEMTYLAEPAEGEPGVEETDAATTEAEATPQADEQDKPDFDREAMRRRIEETRARLKAKAFDAMVQGESFISTETEANSSGEEVDIDSESDDVIERSLKEED
jgi:hypothetical protein